MVWIPEHVAYETALDRMILANGKSLGLRRKAAGGDAAPAAGPALDVDDADDDAATDIAKALRGIFSLRVDADVVRARVDTVRSRQAHLQTLLRQPGIEQRTDAWYAARHNLVTASDIDAATKPAGATREFLKKKCGPAPSASTPSPFSGGGGGPAPLKHGVVFEAVANAIYRSRQGGGCAVHEFGLLRHPTVAHLGASPDGINELGVMVEIKCPYSRKIDGLVPGAYFAQIQGQLEVCGLEECDYVECEIANAIVGPCGGDDGDGFYTAMASAVPGQVHGIVVESSDAKYEYSPLSSALPNPVKDLRAWESAHVHFHSTALVHRWRLDRFNVVRVLRNSAYVADMLAGLERTWAQVLRYRGDPDAYRREVVTLSGLMHGASDVHGGASGTPSMSGTSVAMPAAASSSASRSAHRGAAAAAKPPVQHQTYAFVEDC